jgi:hypothetical protein
LRIDARLIAFAFYRSATSHRCVAITLGVDLAGTGTFAIRFGSRLRLPRCIGGSLSGGLPGFGGFARLFCSSACRRCVVAITFGYRLRLFGCVAAGFG